MENEINQTYIILKGYVEMNKYRYLYLVIMFTAYILILCSNSTIVGLIWVNKNLHEPMYVFIAALLINSLLYSNMVFPKLLIDLLSTKQLISYSACLFQWFAYYSMAGSEFFLLAAMAYDRFVSISNPLQYPVIMRRSNLCVFLFFSWFLPACQVSVPISMNANKRLCRFSLTGIVCNSMVYKLHCIRSVVLNIYGLVSLVNLVLLPLLFIVFTYIRVLILCYQSSREIRTKAVQTCFPHLIVLINFSCLSVFDVLLLRLENDLPTTVHFVMTLQMFLYHPLFNPVIYGLKMKEIYKHVKKLFVHFFRIHI